MDIIINLKDWVHNAHFLPLELVGIITIIGFYMGRLISKVKLPSILGYMLIGIILGPSFLDLLGDSVQVRLSFIPEMALGFVALSIGLELNFHSLKKLGKGIIYVILFESLGAFVLVFAALYFLTKNIPLSLIFACIAPASAPAGTVAIIQEYKAKGPLTKALYAVVGFDDGLGIIIFGFGASIAKNLLMNESGSKSIPFYLLMLDPLKEVILSVFVGIILAYVFSLLIRKITNNVHMFILIFGFVLTITGLCDHLHLSYILTNMIFGITLVNKVNSSIIKKIEIEFRAIMPLLFILFFTLAGANLHIKALSSLGLLGIVYILSRTLGLIGGSRIGAVIGNMSENIKKYLGMGILSQAGVAIGLSLIVKQDFKGIGKLTNFGGAMMTTGEIIGMTVITTVTATCIFFEIVGPILTKIALKKAGEINT